MNPNRCRRHCWLDEACILCGTGDQHRHCYGGEWHVCAWLEPLEHDAPRKGMR